MPFSAKRKSMFVFGERTLSAVLYGVNPSSACWTINKDKGLYLHFRFDTALLVPTKDQSNPSPLSRSSTKAAR